MDENSFRERVHAAYLKALDKFSQSDIGRDIGASADSMRGFKARKSLGKQSLADLERWLAAHGYLDAGAAQPGQATAQPTQPTQPPAPPAAQADSTTQADAFARLAAELHALADHLSSPLPADIRLVTYMAAIKRYAATLDAKEKELKEQIK